jgi:CBS domain-containing protein
MTIMTILGVKGRAVHTIAPDVTIAEATQRMRRERVGALVVADSGPRIAGIVSDRGILWALVDRGVEIMSEPVSTVMTREVITCSAEDEVSAIMAVMTERRIRHIPVVDADGRLGGIVSIGDVVKHRLDEIEHEAEAMRDYITSAR